MMSANHRYAEAAEFLREKVSEARALVGPRDKLTLHFREMRCMNIAWDPEASAAALRAIVAELEDRLRIVLQDHGFAMPRRSRLVDLLRVWRSHTKKTSPRALAYSLCRKFMHCSVDEIPDPEEKRKSKAIRLMSYIK